MHIVIKFIGSVILLCGVVSWRFIWGTKQQATWFHENLGYYWMWGLLIFLIYSSFSAIDAGRDLRGRVWKTIVQHKWPLLLIAACSGFLHVHEPHVFKVMYDEPSHLHVSQMMHFERQVMLASRTHFIGDHLTFLNLTPPFRQYFYSFLLCLGHDLFGYSPSAPFVLNAILGGALLVAAYTAGNIVGGKNAGIFAVLSLTALPLLAQNVTSGGYDVLNLLFVSLFPIAGVSFILASTETAGKWLNVIGAIAWGASQVRYESLLFFGGVGALILLRRLLVREWVMTWPLCFVPLALLPCFAANMVMMKTDAMTLAGLRLPGESFMGIQHFTGNFQDLLAYLYMYDRKGTASVFVSIIGTVGCVGLVARCASGWREKSPNLLVLLVVSVLFLNVVLCYIPALLHFWSSPLDGLAARFTLPIWFCLCIGGAWLIATELRRWPRAQFAALGAAALALIIGSASASADHSTTDFMIPSRAERWFLEFANKQDRQSSLFVSKSDLNLIAHGYAAIGLAALNGTPEKGVKIIQSGIYRNIYILERKEFPATQEVPVRNETVLIASNIVVEELFSRSFAPGVLARIVRFVGYKDADGQLITRDSASQIPQIFESDAKRRSYLFSLYP